MEKIDTSELNIIDRKVVSGVTIATRDTSMDVLADKINEIVEWINENSTKREEMEG